MILVSALVFQQAASTPVALAWRNGLLCVPLLIGGDHPLWFLLDTGAQRSSVGTKAYARLAATGARVEDDGTLAVGEVGVGGLAVRDLRLVKEDSREEEGFGESVDGILGTDMLARYQVGLDLREKTLRLWRADVPIEGWFTAPPEERVCVALRDRPEGWCVPVDVGNLTVPMVLDTGASETFLHTDVAALLLGAKWAKGNELRAPFYDGMHRVRTYAVRSVGIGGASFGERTIRAAGVPLMVGLMGRDLLSPLKALLDYPHGTATFVGLTGNTLPPADGPGVTLPNGVVVHWPLGEVANAPPGCAYTLPKGYREVFNRDESVSLVPPKGF